MWIYEKKLQYPVNIKNPNPALAKMIISQLGGPDGELAASLRYLSQRYTAPYAQVKGILTDVGTEELAHVEMISSIVYQLTKNLTPEQIKQGGLDAYYVDHTLGIYPSSAAGVRSPQRTSSQREIFSPTSMKTWLRNRKLARPTIISCVLQMIPMSVTP